MKMLSNYHYSTIADRRFHLKSQAARLFFHLVFGRQKSSESCMKVIQQLSGTWESFNSHLLLIWGSFQNISESLRSTYVNFHFYESSLIFKSLYYMFLLAKLQIFVSKKKAIEIWIQKLLLLRAMPEATQCCFPRRKSIM